MSVERVLAAAAALRDFTVDELAVFCDEQPPAILAILDGARSRVERTDAAADPAVARWRVVDLAGLRCDLAVRGGKSTSQSGRVLAEPRRRVAALPTTRLLLAEQTLAECAVAQSASERRILVATAKNHLQQVVASTFPETNPWWSVELSLPRLNAAIERDLDEAVSARLRLDVALTCLVECEVTGRPMPAQDLVDTVLGFQRMIGVLEEPQLSGLIGCFFDLVIAQLVPGDPSSIPAPERLIAAVARRRVRAQVAHAQVEHGVGAAMHALVPLLHSLGKPLGLGREQGLYQVLGHLPDGRVRIVVYTDLLQILPRQYAWQAAAELVPGALVEAVTEPEATIRLACCAQALERDLVGSPFGSDAALIGQAAHVFQDLADQAASLDGTVLDRSDRTRSELLTLAKARVWPPYPHHAYRFSAGSP